MGWQQAFRRDTGSFEEHLRAGSIEECCDVAEASITELPGEGRFTERHRVASITGHCRTVAGCRRAVVQRDGASRTHRVGSFMENPGAVEVSTVSIVG